MKKYLVTALLTLVCFILQSAILPVLDFGGIMPNLLVVFVAACGFMNGEKYGLVTGFACGLLADIRPGEDAPSWKQGRDKKPIDKRQERLSALETAYDACNMGDGVTIADLMAYMGKTKNTVRSYIDEHPDFERDGGTVRRISQQEQPACAPF